MFCRCDGIVEDDDDERLNYVRIILCPKYFNNANIWFSHPFLILIVIIIILVGILPFTMMVEDILRDVLREE